jgi:hypothetical protein
MAFPGEVYVVRYANNRAAHNQQPE